MKAITIEAVVTIEDEDDSEALVDVVNSSLAQIADIGVPVGITCFDVTVTSEREVSAEDFE